jgi:hypothetical protein
MRPHRPETAGGNVMTRAAARRSGLIGWPNPSPSGVWVPTGRRSIFTRGLICLTEDLGITLLL